MGFFHPSVPPYMLAWGARSLPPGSLAIETGTYQGDSADLLFHAFGKCVTIERSKELAERAAERFANTDDLEVLHGSSRERLGEALDDAMSAPFVWLDAHWSGGLTAGSDDPCPVLAEIESVRARFPGQAVILVDDARIFGASDPDDQFNSEWPSLFDVLKALEDGGWKTYVMDDVVAGIPPELAPSFSRLAPEAMTSRLGTLKATTVRLTVRRVTNELTTRVAGLAERRRAKGVPTTSAEPGGSSRTD